MTPRRSFIITILGLIVTCLLAPYASAQSLAPAEKTKIEALIQKVETLKDASFIRNGSTYDAKTAGKFLRGKWQQNEKQVTSAQSFISIVGTKSNTSGKPYMIRYKDGREIPCATYLQEQLQALSAK